MRAARRVLQHVIAGTALLLLPVAPALAEFEIQESTIDPGEIQLQYRGAWHSGLPKGDAADLDVLPDEEEAPLRQSHDVELQMSITSRWLVALTHTFDEPIADDFRLSALEVESQIELITLVGDGLGLAVQGGVEKPLLEARREEAPDFSLGPIIELAKSDFLLTLNPLFFREFGELAEQEGWGFEYGWQAKYDVTERLALALEMFGEIDELRNSGPFDEQQHSIGPAFYYTLGEAEVDEFGKGEGAELVLSLGAQFGLTEQTSDAALKVFIGYEFF
jgi:hypothetical protein